MQLTGIFKYPHHALHSGTISTTRYYITFFICFDTKTGTCCYVMTSNHSFTFDLFSISTDPNIIHDVYDAKVMEILFQFR